MLEWVLGWQASALERRHSPAGLPAPAFAARAPAALPQNAPPPWLHPAPQAAAFEAGRQLEAQVTAATAALQELRALADELEAEGQARAADAAADREKAAANGGRAERYVAQQAQLEAGLAAAGYAPEVRLGGRGGRCGPGGRRGRASVATGGVQGCSDGR